MRVQAENGNWIAEKCENCEFVDYECADYVDCHHYECIGKHRCDQSTMMCHGLQDRAGLFGFPFNPAPGCFRPNKDMLATIWDDGGGVYYPEDDDFDEACKWHVSRVF